ncbi:hypothetical protein ACR73B_16710 [Enterococcus innesii]|uniref:DUF4376 domain-containing protein n=1 Tax=Enterococcus innesii TaxID=2839759 RepID=UPI003DA2B6DD
MIYSIKDGKYSGDNTLSTAWGAAFIAGAAERGYECACWPDTETPDFHARRVHTPADSKDNVSEDGISISLTLAEMKGFKLMQVKNATEGFDSKRKDPSMFFKSSLGFSVDGDARSRDNLDGLKAIGIEPVTFRDHDNIDHSLTLANLELLIKEVNMTRTQLYQPKWKLQAQIDGAKSIKELRAIEIVFRMADFAHD